MKVLARRATTTPSHASWKGRKPAWGRVNKIEIIFKFDFLPHNATHFLTCPSPCIPPPEMLGHDFDADISKSHPLSSGAPKQSSVLGKFKPPEYQKLKRLCHHFPGNRQRTGGTLPHHPVAVKWEIKRRKKPADGCRSPNTYPLAKVKVQEEKLKHCLIKSNGF